MLGKLIERQRHIVDFTLSTLCRRKGRSVSLYFAYAAVVFLLASIVFFIGAIREEGLTLLEGAPEMIVQRSVAGCHALMPIDYMSNLRTIEGVDAVRGRLWGYYYDPVAGANYTLIASRNFEGSTGKIAIGEGVSRTRLAFPGDTVEFLDSGGAVMSLEVQHVLPPQSELVSSDLVLLTEDDFRQLGGMPEGYVTDLVVTARNSQERSAISRRITERMPDVRVISRDEILSTYDHIFSWRGNALVFISGAALALIIFIWDKAFGLSQEQRNEIGILKAIGWDAGDVMLFKFWEGLIISSSSFLTGAILAYGHIFLTKSILFQPVLRGWAVLYPSFDLVPFVDPAKVVALFLVTVAPYILATILPAWKAASVDPDAAVVG